mgnify:CR=1 FL=1
MFETLPPDTDDPAATREKAAATPAQEFQPRGEEHGRFLNSTY